MTTFPDLPNPDYPLKMNPEDNTITSKFEDGSTQVRRKMTKSRRTFTLTWNEMKTEQFKILDNWVRNIAHFGCETFKWTNPGTGEQITARISSYKDPQLLKVNYWNVTLEITEV
ncbi:hypothetical protein [Acidaminococcus massiliensis]|uniref:hypothetical protein n=1 Tax=Acidaminococcus massiliensis TaxID=1852375 RepID=UPI0023F00E99|nr:hypothetical protein [Acidaminococcus massiliensis]